MWHASLLWLAEPLSICSEVFLFVFFQSWKWKVRPRRARTFFFFNQRRKESGLFFLNNRRLFFLKSFYTKKQNVEVRESFHTSLIPPERIWAPAARNKDWVSSERTGGQRSRPKTSSPSHAEGAGSHVVLLIPRTHKPRTDPTAQSRFH